MSSHTCRVVTPRDRVIFQLNQAIAKLPESDLDLLTAIAQRLAHAQTPPDENKP